MSFQGKRTTINQHLVTNHLIQVVEDTLKLREELVTIKSENQKLCSEISLLTPCKEYNVKGIERLRNTVQQLEKERAVTDAPQYQFVEKKDACSVATRVSIQCLSSSKKLRILSEYFEAIQSMPLQLMKCICDWMFLMSRQLMILANSYGRFLIFFDVIMMLLKGKQSAFIFTSILYQHPWLSCVYLYLPQW